MEDLAPGDPSEVGGYRLRCRLGAGGMGVVYLALTPAGRALALKVLRPEFGDDPEFRARFRQEVAAARRVSGLFTAQVVDANPDGSPPWLATVYVPGPSLAQAVAVNGPLPQQRVLSLVAGVAEALAAIHGAGLVHRDLKPSNVLLAEDGPRVIDFGIAQAAEAAVLTRTGTQLGSPQYMAPEQVRGEAVGPAADIWALGALACFAATGRSPFGEGAEAAVLYRVLHAEPDLARCPGSLRVVIEQCLARDPAARPSPAQILDLCRAGAVPGPPASSVPAPGTPAQQAALQQAPPRQAPPRQAPPRQAPPQPPPLPAMLAGVSGPPPPPARRPYLAMAVASVSAAVVLAVLIGFGVAALRPGGGSSTPSASGHQVGQPGVGGPGSQGTSTSGPGQPDPAAAGATAPTQTPAVDPCLVGTWTVTSQQVRDTIDGEPTQFTGDTGWTVTIGPDGQANETFDHSELTATVGGNVWEEILNGSATYDVITVGAQMIFSHQSASGTWELLENGSHNEGGPLMLNTSPATYSCSATAVTEASTDGNDESSFRRAG